MSTMEVSGSENMRSRTPTFVNSLSLKSSFCSLRNEGRSARRWPSPSPVFLRLSSVTGDESRRAARANKASEPSPQMITNFRLVERSSEVRASQARRLANKGPMLEPSGANANFLSLDAFLSAAASDTITASSAPGFSVDSSSSNG
eukprot:Amastigsp_a1301_13.p7 type:complete len:146 gc:universal Amastigsp_a1301_13:1400-963(-)